MNASSLVLTRLLGAWLSIESPHGVIYRLLFLLLPLTALTLIKPLLLPLC